MKDKTALERAALYLENSQLQDGGFISVSAPTKYAKQGNETYHTTFFPSLILLALSEVSHPSLANVKKRLADFLVEQKSTAWSFNYWDKKSEERLSKPYPDDLDDSFCALAALYRERPKLFTPTVLAATAHLLMATEVQEGGPYKTWLTPDDNPAWHDIDVAVNTNVGYFLQLQQIELPSIVDLVETAIKHDKLKSPYYPNIYPLVYFMARWYRGPYTQSLTEKLLARKKGPAWQHPQRTAMAITSLLRLGYDPQRLKPAVEYLLQLQQPNGSWEAQAFCVDPSVEDQVYYAHSQALSTALSIEAITLYETFSSNDKKAAPLVRANQQFYDSVIETIKERMQAVDQDDLKQALETILERITAQDKDSQIILLPLMIAQSFGLKPAKKVMYQLASCSVWGWMAYSTYDDFLDGEGEARLLPATNVCLRQLVEQLLTTLPTNKEFHAEVDIIMNRLDGANAWELAHCRGSVDGDILHLKQMPDYGDYWQLADRSLGHTISALGVLYAEGKGSKSPAVAALRDFMYHYLIARQLNDDAHDWYEDLLSGHVNAVGAMLLSAVYPIIPKGGLKLDVVKRKSSLEQRLWEEIIDHVCAEIKRHVVEARNALQSRGINGKIAAFEKMLQPIELGAELSLQKRNEALEFIAAL